MQRSSVPTKHHGFALLACVAGILFAQAALADCPPGMHPSGAGDRAHPAKCAPDRTRTLRGNVHVPAAITRQASTPRVTTPKQRDWRKTGPSIGPGPVEHVAASNPRAIIFTGGKNAINSQPVPPGKATLNPQPIPPGHMLHQPPHSSTRASQKMRWGVKRNKES